MTSTLITTLILLVGIVMVNGSSIKNCCNVAVKHHYFSINKNSSGVYNIIDFCQQGTTVQGYCDTLTDGGGWLVIQRRKDGSENFERFWWEYQMGFGSLTGEFGFGLNALHCLTSKGQWELRIDLKLTNGTIVYLPYKKFVVGPATQQYPLTILGFSGYTTDPFNSHQTIITNPGYALNTMKFTTRDQDNDRSRSGINCAVNTHNVYRAGGWWYNSCADIFPNNLYNNKYRILLNGQWHSPPFFEVKIRPQNCT